MMDRRAFLGVIPLSAAVAGAMRDPRNAMASYPAGDGPEPASRWGTGPGARAGRQELEGWGVQLYTLRSPLDDALQETLEAVAEMGYREVELFQLHGRTPSQMRTLLDAAGLSATSSHYGLAALEDDLERTLESALTLGQRLMVVPSIPPSRRDVAGLAGVAETLNRAGERIRSAGLRLGYHNHDWELRAVADGRRPIDVLLDATEAGLVDWQMDIFWTVHGGGDPLAMLRERSGRVTSVHVKDRTADGRMVSVGDGVIDFGEVLAVAEAQGLAHAYVEHDRPDQPLQSVRRSLRHLQTLDVGQAGNGVGA